MNFAGTEMRICLHLRQPWLLSLLDLQADCSLGGPISHKDWFIGASHDSLSRYAGILMRLDALASTSSSMMILPLTLPLRTETCFLFSNLKQTKINPAFL